MKRPATVRRLDRSNLARKRALIRSLIEQTGWAQSHPDASPAAIVDFPAEPVRRAAPQPRAEIIPFPKGGSL